MNLTFFVGNWVAQRRMVNIQAFSRHEAPAPKRRLARAEATVDFRAMKEYPQPQSSAEQRQILAHLDALLAEKGLLQSRLRGVVQGNRALQAIAFGVDQPVQMAVGSAKMDDAVAISNDGRRHRTASRSRTKIMAWVGIWSTQAMTAAKVKWTAYFS